MSLFEDDPVGPAAERVAKRIETGGSALVRGLRNVARGTAAIAFTPAALGLGVFTAGLVGAAGALRSVTTEASALARSLASMRANNGLSFKQGLGVALRNSLFGISPQQTAQIYGNPAMNPMLAGARGRALGFGNYTDPNFYEKMARSYQGMANRSPGGRMQANARLDAYYGGQAPDDVRQLVNLRPQQIRKQLDFGSGVQVQMGISPEMLRRYAEEIPLATQRLGFAVSQARIKLAVELAPFIERTFSGIAIHIGKNAGKIARGIETGVRFVTEVLPVSLMRGGAFLLRGGATLLRGFSFFSLGLAGNVKPILSVFDLIINGVGAFVLALKGVYNTLQKMGVPQAAQWAGSKMSNQPNSTPENRAANGIIGGAALNYGVPIAAGVAWRVVAARRATAAAARAAAVSAAARTAGASGPYRFGVPGGRAIPRGVLPGGAGVRAGIATAVTRTGLARALSLPVVAAGVAMGTGGYELMRRYNVLGYKSMPSTAQILGTYTGLTPSPTQQAAAYASTRRVAGGAVSSPQNALPALGRSNLANDPALKNVLQQLATAGGNATGRGAQNLTSLADTLESKANNFPAMLAELQKLNAKTEQTNRILDRHGNPFDENKALGRLENQFAGKAVRTIRRMR